jgi:hypothetical protein
MKRVFVVICAVLTASIGVSIAAAASVRSSVAWTESKAERVVVRDATVRLAPSEKASLERELLDAVRLYTALELAARDEGNSEAAAAYHRIAYKFGRALKNVRSGLGVDEAECTGSGRAQGGRFTRFRCGVTSEELQIPAVEFVYSEDGSLREVIEGEQRSLGTFQAMLDVRITGKSGISYRQLGAQAGAAPQRDDRPGGFVPG